MPGRGAVLSISRSSSAIERRYLLTHESFHGVFFSSLEYREFCFRLWDSLPEAERQFYSSFLDSLGYDSDDRLLSVNEFQAYLMQQPLKYAASFFERFLTRFAEQETHGGVKASSLVATAKALDAFLHSNLASGQARRSFPSIRRRRADETLQVVILLFSFVAFPHSRILTYSSTTRWL